MNKNRLEAFSDGVLAIIITIMVMEINVPKEPDFVSLIPLLPVFVSYVLSFIYLGIYWNNHHHMLHTVERVNGAILWANLHLLFWLSLVPFVTGWVGENHFMPLPLALYGFVLFMCSVAYWILQRLILRAHGSDSILNRAIGRDLKGKLSPFLYLVAIISTFFTSWIAGGIYTLVAFWWLIPDRRIEVIFKKEQEKNSDE